MLTKIGKHGILTLLLVFAGVFAVPDVLADNLVKCKVLTIEATNDSSGVPLSLNAYASIFRQKPFDAYSGFRLVDTQEYSLKLNTQLQLVLPDQLSGTLLYKGKLTNHQLQLTLSLGKADNQPIIIDGTATSGTPFLAAGFKSPSGRWIFAVKCSE